MYSERQNECGLNFEFHDHGKKGDPGNEVGKLAASCGESVSRRQF